MTVRGRLLAIKLLEQKKKNSEYLKRLGIKVDITIAKSIQEERRE